MKINQKLILGVTAIYGGRLNRIVVTDSASNMDHRDGDQRRLGNWQKII